MKRSIKADEYTCDGCGKVTVVEPHEEKPLGFHLQASRIHHGGGDFADDIFACTEKCIRAAVVGALDERGRG